MVGKGLRTDRSLRNIQRKNEKTKYPTHYSDKEQSELIWTFGVYFLHNQG